MKRYKSWKKWDEEYIKRIKKLREKTKRFEEAIERLKEEENKKLRKKTKPFEEAIKRLKKELDDWVDTVHVPRQPLRKRNIKSWRKSGIDLSEIRR